MVVNGPGARTTGPELGPQISGDFPAVTQALLAAARVRA